MNHKGYLRVRNILIAAQYSFAYIEAYLYSKFHSIYSISQIKQDLINYKGDIK